MYELVELRHAVTKAETAAKVAEFNEKFDVSAECEQSEIERAATTSVALDKLTEKHNLGHDGPAHHCAIGIGHIGNKIEKVAALSGIKCTRVC